MLAHEFIRNALLAGSCVALASGAIGYFVVLRGQVFAGDALSHVAFTGALAAAAAGWDLRVGLFLATVAVALGLAALGRREPADDTTIGVVFSWVLGLGVLFLYLYSSGSAGGEGAVAARTLFGSIFSLSRGEAWVAAGVGIGLLVALGAIARPLLFATLDPAVARVRGVPVRALGLAFLVLLGVDAGEATQAVGALLLLGLLAAPAGAAQRLTANPVLGMALSMTIALGSVWVGVTLSYAISALPPGSAIVGVAVGCYVLAALIGGRIRRGRRMRRGGAIPSRA
ncbi:MAG TPA: metal ABC transporter permease [Solirubrobacteraceae bacterium]|jgi:zinc/manganese transport system permease protein|nr:metal ABC transporter permease [Solirubrobacteraceae bacterium]